MANSPGFVQRVWSSIKEEIAQPVPQELQFCEFECPFEHCQLETKGSCEFLPYGLVPIQPAQVAARSDWPGIPAIAASSPAFPVN